VAAALQNAAAAALQLIQQQLEGAAAGAAGAAAADDEDHTAEALLQLEVLVACLDAPPSSQQQQRPEAAAMAATAADERLSPLRSALWQVLTSFLAAVPSASYGHSAMSALLELQESITSSGRWGRWQPPGGPAAGAGVVEASPAGARSKDGGVGDAGEVVVVAGGVAGAGLLFARTMAALGREWPGFQVGGWLGVGLQQNTAWGGSRSSQNLPAIALRRLPPLDRVTLDLQNPTSP